MKTKHLVLRVTEEFKARVKKAAERDNKSLSAYVVDLVLADFAKKEKKNELQNGCK